MATEIDDSGSEPAPRQLLCVLGMHRSGTSAVTQLLHRLGAKVGPQLLEAMSGVNEEGFWEDSRVVELNERLLAALGSCWQDYSQLDFSLLDTTADPAAITALRGEAKAYFAEHYASVGTWVIKDPRLCRLLPFWRDVWREVGLETCFVQVLRHPYAVAKSLYRRDRTPVEYGVLLWLVYTFEAMSHSAGRPGIVVAFDAFADSPLELPRLLESQCGVRWSLDRTRWKEAAAATLKHDLRHHDDQSLGSTGLRDLVAFAAVAYEALYSLGGQLPGEMLLANLHSEWRALLNRYDDELAMLRRTTDDTMALSAECVRIGTLHSRALSVIQDKDKILAETNRQLEEIARLHSEIRQLIKDIAYFRWWRAVPRLVRIIGRR